MSQNRLWIPLTVLGLALLSLVILSGWTLQDLLT
jgi:hypothetical protein